MGADRDEVRVCVPYTPAGGGVDGGPVPIVEEDTCGTGALPVCTGV